jgi:hypothetical protein
MALSPEVLERLSAMNIELHLLSADGVDIVVKRPDRPSYKRFRAMVSDQAKRADAPETLVRDCIVYPTREEFNTLLESKPALGDVFGAKLLDLAGMTAEADAKKL